MITEPLVIPERRELRRRLEFLAYPMWLADLMQSTLDYVDEIARYRPELIAMMPELLPLLPPQLPAGRGQTDQREFAIQYTDGGMREWSCGCPVIYDSLDLADLIEQNWPDNLDPIGVIALTARRLMDATKPTPSQRVRGTLRRMRQQ